MLNKRQISGIAQEAWGELPEELGDILKFALYSDSVPECTVAGLRGQGISGGSH